ncbi:MAG: lysozyme inhibitor LprI family protein, partial [Hansschlegelia sp.]
MRSDLRFSGIRIALCALIVAGSGLSGMGVGRAVEPSDGPSFDCRRAKRDDTRAICATSELAALDRQLAEAFVAARRRMTDEGARDLSREQRVWLDRRAACRTDVSCIRTSMQRRIAELQDLAGDGAGAADLSSGQDAESAVAAETGPNRPALASAFAQKLADPPSGFEPWDFALIEGVPLLNWEAATRLARLAALAAEPERINDDAYTLIRQYMTKTARMELLGEREFLPPWGGGDEFVRAERRKRFRDKYAERFLEIAPKPPFEFGYLLEADLAEYDEARNAFPIRLSGQVLEEALRRAGFRRALPDFQLPKLELLVRDDPAGFVRGLDRRRVAIVERVVISSVDRNAINYRLTSLKIYTPDLKTLLATIPVANDDAAFLSAPTPPKLTAASPTPLDEFATCVEVIAALGADAPADAVDRCWSVVGDRDARFYASASGTPLAPDDARRPFFPRGGAERSPEGLAAFVRWAKAVAAGFASVDVSLTGNVYRPDNKADQTTFYALNASQFQEPTSTLIQSENLQDDQVARLGDLRGVAILGALPNRATLYSIAVPRAAIERRPGASMTMSSTFRITSVKLLQAGPRPILMLGLTPNSVTVTGGGETLAERSFGDVPALDPAAFVANEPALALSRGVSGVLDAAAFDL